MITELFISLVSLIVAAVLTSMWHQARLISGTIGGKRAVWEIVRGFSHRDTVVRFSASAALRFQNPRGDGKYILCKSRGDSTHGTWGPLGGVIKCNRVRTETKFSDLNIRFHRSDSASASLDADMLQDLRVVMRRRSLVGFLRWFAQDIEREFPVTALVRELQEELLEGILGVDSALSDVSKDFARDLNELLPHLSWDSNHHPVVSIYREQLGTVGAPRLVLHIKAYYMVTSNDPDDLMKVFERAMRGAFGQELGWFDLFSIQETDGRDIGVHSQSLLGKIDATKQLPIYSPNGLRI